MREAYFARNRHACMSCTINCNLTYHEVAPSLQTMLLYRISLYIPTLLQPYSRYISCHKSFPSAVTLYFPTQPHTSTHIPTHPHTFPQALPQIMVFCRKTQYKFHYDTVILMRFTYTQLPSYPLKSPCIPTHPHSFTAHHRSYCYTVLPHTTLLLSKPRTFPYVPTRRCTSLCIPTQVDWPVARA